MFSTMNEIEVIMAIKLGTNYSTNAYMIKHVDPDDRKMLNVPFKTQTTSQMSVTTPTVALFDDNGTIKSYGSEAELQYIQQADRSNHLLFREFIWHLFCADDTIPENLSDVNGKRMNSIDVLSSVIEYMVSHVKFETGKDIRGIPITFKYVFTIPTCSCEDSKRFMSEAAVKAGCSPNDIIVVEEATAALQFFMTSQYNGELQVLGDVIDRCFLVVELEDDNVTISILNYINDERIGILFRNTAEVWGSCQIQKDIVEMLSCETNETLLDGFFEKYPLEHFELIQEIKKKIKYTLPETSRRVAIKMSAVMLEKNGGFEGMQKAVLKTGLKDKLDFKLDKCIISPEAFQSLFTDAGKQIVQYLKKELPTDLSDINSIILIGEFAQSPILQDMIKRYFSRINIHVPGEANMAAVKGAVLVGENNIHVETSGCICRSKESITENVCPSEGNVQRSSTKESVSEPTKIKSEKRNKSRLCVIQ